MEQKVLNYIQENKLIHQGDRLYIGVSGGADSVCLLLILSKLQKELGICIEVIHVEHGIRGKESVSDARFVENLCQKLMIPFQMVRVDVPEYAKANHLGYEEAARILRYEAFKKAVQEDQSVNSKIVLAHHMDDNAETILFQMIRGSGLTGMCGMRPIRWEDANICYIRPLLAVSRSEIEAYLNAQQQEYCIDATNAELDYSRNRIRNIVIPELEKVNERAVLHMNQTARQLLEVKNCMDAVVDFACKDLLQKKEDGVIIDCDLLEAQPLAVAKESIRRAIILASGKQKDISAVHVADVLKLVDTQSGKQIHLPYQLVAKKEYHRIIITQNGKDDMQEYCFAVTQDELQAFFDQCMAHDFSKEESMEIVLSDGMGKMCCRICKNEGNPLEIPKKGYTKWLDYDKIKYGFVVRNRRAGDYFYSDELGHRKKLKDFFINEKVPVSKRNGVLLLTRDSQVFWIVGNRISEDCKVTENTKYIFEVEYYGGK